MYHELPALEVKTSEIPRLKQSGTPSEYKDFDKSFLGDSTSQVDIFFQGNVQKKCNTR